MVNLKNSIALYEGSSGLELRHKRGVLAEMRDEREVLKTTLNIKAVLSTNEKMQCFVAPLPNQAARHFTNSAHAMLPRCGMQRIPMLLRIVMSSSCCRRDCIRGIQAERRKGARNAGVIGKGRPCMAC